MNFLAPANWFTKPHPIITENGATFRNFDQSRPLHEYSFVVFDTELTGLNRKKDELISIGAVKIINLQISLDQMFYSLVRPEKLQDTEATLVHRITPEQLRKAPLITTVLPDFIRFIEGSMLVGHYLILDMNFINRAASKLFKGTLSNPGIDTMKMAQAYRRIIKGHYYNQQDFSYSYNLSDLSKEFKLPFFKAHDALEDAMQTAYLFLYLIKKFRRGGLRTLRDLYRAGRY